MTVDGDHIPQSGNQQEDNNINFCYKQRGFMWTILALNTHSLHPMRLKAIDNEMTTFLSSRSRYTGCGRNTWQFPADVVHVRRLQRHLAGRRHGHGVRLRPAVFRRVLHPLLVENALHRADEIPNYDGFFR